MTEQTSQAGVRPIFYNRLMTLDRELHAGMKFDPSVGFGYAAKAHLVPITIAEFRYVSRFYPIVFGGSPIPMPFAVMGIQQNTNLMVDADGNWRPRTYMPAAVNTYPFILLPVRKDSDEVSVVIDPDAKSLNTGNGEPLFVDGKSSPLLDRIVPLVSQYRTAIKATIEFGKFLAEADLLVQRGIELRLRDGSMSRIDNFTTIDPEKFETAANNIFLRWRKDGWLLPIFQYMFSYDAWTALAELESDRREAKAAAKA